MGGIYLTPQRIISIKSPSVIGGLIRALINRSGSVHDRPIAEIVSRSRANNHPGKITPTSMAYGIPCRNQGGQFIKAYPWKDR